jgi:ribosome biogenesis GTPase
MPSSLSSADREGRVVSGHGRHVVVESADGERVLCHARGKKSDAVVGDRVAWRRTGDEGVVEKVLPRDNLLYRQDEWKTKAFAANLDRLLVVVAAEPVFSESQLARALIAAREAKIGARIVLNKRDLPGWADAAARLAPYVAMGVEVIGVALKKEPDASRAVLSTLLAGRTTLVLGPSGAGKSTLVNLMVVDAGAQVGEISSALNTGRHTTTATHWYWIDRAGGSALIDSPGFQEFGLRHIAPTELTALMPDIAAKASACRFYNCTHVHEPGCGVLAAVERSEIGEARYRIYREILQELQG